MSLKTWLTIHVSISLMCLNNFNKAIKKRNVPILFFANKMDLGQAMTEGEVAKEMLLHQLTDR